MNDLPGAAGTASFLYVTCQAGVEKPLKDEVARDYPDLRFAYSRPGFVTFKLTTGAALDQPYTFRAVFARAWGFSLGKALEPDPFERARQVWTLAGPTAFDALHVWQRDSAPAGDHRYEPGLTDLAAQIGGRILAAHPSGADFALPLNAVVAPGGQVLDCVLVESDEWWIGRHCARTTASCVPGGFFPIPLPDQLVSRAYFKMEEALAWSQLPLVAGDRVVEIGCAPGGAAQALLDRGLHVTGVDPADVDPLVASHPKFTHVRKRGADIRRRDFRGVRWLTADMNVAPEYTLTTVEQIVTHPEIKIEGLILTLKLLNWSLAADIPAALERVRSWGYPWVEARQLAHNRQDICVVASRQPLRSAAPS